MPRDTVRTIYVARAAALAVLLVAIWTLRWTTAASLPAVIASALVLLVLLPTLVTLAWRGDVPVSLVTLGFVLDIVGVTVGVHLAGGLDASLAPFLYAVIVAAISLLFSMRAAFVCATACAAAYAGILSLEHAGWLPHYAQLGSPGQRVLARSVMVTLFLYVVAWMVSYVVRRFTADLRRQKAEVERHARALEKAVVALEGFGYAVSHHLRSPLRAIDGFSAAVLDEQGDRLDAAGRSDLQRVRAAANQMGQLIDAFVRLSRLGHGALQIEDVDLGEAARRIAVRLAASEPGRQVTWSIEPGVTARGDAALLGIALRHLLENAWKFTAPHPRAHIALGALNGGSERVYFVSDDGVGFDMAHAQKLFEPFERLHGREEFPGMGMGLVTVQRIVERHGGRAWAEGGIEQGATFYFTLGGQEEEEGMGPGRP